MRLGRLALSFAIGVGIAAASPAPAQQTPTTFTSMTVFGDSLVDAGNVYTFTGGAIPSPSQGYFEGRFTNGYNFADQLSIYLFGRPTQASLQGGTNFAFGGARATSTSDSLDLAGQLALFQSSHQPIDQTGLYVLTFGGNDVRAALASTTPAGFPSDDAFLQAAALNYAQGVQTLSNLGVRDFLITGFPVPDPLSALADNYLNSDLAALNLPADTHIYFFDPLSFFNLLTSNPTSFGLPSNLNLTTNCQAAGALPDCTGYFYFDAIHPTAAVHSAAATFIERQFSFIPAVPEPDTWAMFILAFALMGIALRLERHKGRMLSPEAA